MQDGKTNRGSAAADQLAHESAVYHHKYPAQSNYMAAGAKQPAPAAAWRRQAIILGLAACSALCLSFLGASLADSSKVDDRQTGSTIDSQYPHIGQEVKDLAAALSLTEQGRQIFYDHDPQIFASADHPDFLHNKNISVDQRITINGYWSATTDKIYLIRDDKLEATAAHEFLHAIYYDLYISGQHETINEYITAAFNQNADELRPLISAYGDLLSNTGEFSELNRYNELHSFIGTRIETIPDELEAHYAKYFANRRAIIQLNAEQTDG